jgi:hypothetical protein
LTKDNDIEDPIIGLIPLHFDVPGNYLPLKTFVETANQTRAIIEAFNCELFEGSLRFEVFVLPPEEGSFKTKLGVALCGFCGVVWAFAGSDIGKAFIKGLTTHEPAYWAEKVGGSIREQLIESHGSANLVEKAARSQLRQRFETAIISESTKSFLQADNTDLRRVGITTQKFRNAYDARNRFYEACLQDTKILALGLDEKENFPIKREDFRRLKVILPKEEVPQADVPWEVEIVPLSVTSPNWERQDRQRPWKARDSHGRERYFRIEDLHFWNLVSTQELNLHIVDNIKVQWAYVRDSPRSARVLRVLEYNHLVDRI